ncbi:MULTISPECIES: ABC transporter ATP-binding protein [unclassified Methylobacter]|jgi:putative ABC transport system ATP-binding protein|uniref:ABC transporter ATP-binding protein n=1 Tax=unclassified Methylobacter TaxID=2635283 RepID=UPI0018932F5B|nr:ABC transporter ATP-binding protein [Methylobacter sp. BlB1]MBF6648839.1 ABC transporter ATP-binding protein [Methylobacter sp. BlB1]
MIELENIHRYFQVGEQTVHALNDINLTIDKGEYVSVMGPSGSGKSTLLNVIALLDQPSSGRYRLNGRDVTQLSDDELAKVRRENIGFVFQFFHLIPRLTAAENVEMPMILAGVPAKERKRRVAEALADVNLQNRADHRPDQLSGGQLQRIAIARAMIMRPEILLADEPTGNLDSKSGSEIIELLESLNRQGVTLMIITHDQHIGDRARRKIRIVDGQIRP